MIGVEYPKPTGTFHFGTMPVEGKEEAIPVSVQVPSRLGPRHCGQSAAIRGPAIGNTKHTLSSPVTRRLLTSIRIPICFWLRSIDPSRRLQGIFPAAGFDVKTRIVAVAESTAV